MKFCLLNEADTPKGMTHFHRFHEALEEIELADQVGFDIYGSSEQHFGTSTATISAPETFYGAVAMRTERITLRPTAIQMLNYNHPLRTAERLATLDILSKGRVELATARSNNPRTLGPFGIDPAETRAQWRESTEIVVNALTRDMVEHDGDIWKIPPTTVTPRLYRENMFNVSVICSSKETHTLAGKYGLGAISNDSYIGWDYVEDSARLYHEAARDPHPFADYPVNPTLGWGCLATNVAETRKEAIETSRHVVAGFFKTCVDFFKIMAEKSPDYADLALIDSLESTRGDVRALMEHTPSVMVGTPDDLIEQVRRLEALGFNEVAFRIDGYGHRQNMKAIELIGKYVIPEFKRPQSVVGSAQTPHVYSDQGVEDIPIYSI